MIRAKHLLIFIMILACGLIIEGLKGLSTGKSEKISSLSFRDLDAKPFFISVSDMNADRKRVTAQGGRTRGGFKLSTKDSLTHKNSIQKTAALAKNEAKTTDDAKKKKKKKSKSARGKGKIKETAIEENQYSDSNEDRAVESGTSQAQQFVSQFSPPAKKDDTLPISFEDWAQLILGSPKPENVAKLVEFYTSNMVSGDIFYGILSAMLEESNPEQHKLAVYAAGNVPNAQSFSFLVQVLKTETQGSPASTQASEQINSYQTLNNVGHLKAVLTLQLSDINTVQMAVNVLDKSTQQFLENRTPTAEGTEELTAPANKTNMTKAYMGFESVLEGVIETYKNQPAITEPARRSLTRIKNLTVVVADLNG